MRRNWVLGLAAFVAGCGSSYGGYAAKDRGGSGGDLSGFLGGGSDLAGVDFPPQLTAIYAHTATTLYTVDPTTYELATVGDFGGSDSMTDLAVTPDGNVYTISRTAFYHVDTATGAATQLFAGIASSNVALTFNADGTLLAADQAGAVRRIDPTNGNITELGTYGIGYDTAGDLVAIADGTLFGVSTKAPSLGSTTNVLIKVSTATAQASTVGKIGYQGVYGVAYSGGRVLAFTTKGEIVSIDPTTGSGTLVKTHPGIVFWGAGTTPLMPVL
jgi:streptogramin lyase